MPREVIQTLYAILSYPDQETAISSYYADTVP